MKKLIILIICVIGILLTYLFSDNSDNINSEDLTHLEKILGIQFNETERDSMLESLNQQRSDYKSIRNQKLENRISPSLIFNPLPIGFEINKQQEKNQFSDYSKTELPKDKNDLAYYSVGELAHLIKTKKITSVELTEFYLNRLKKYDEILHCVITLTEERALNLARKADEEIANGNYKGILHGIPYGVKDLLATKDYRTTWGANPFKDQQFDYDAEVIKKLESKGAVIIAKLTLGALAWGDVWFGEMTRNPWDPAKGSSGSSAGSASAVSAGLVPFAIGTETWGSIVSPSTVCGVSGLRPTYGRVSRTGAMALSWSMDKIGPICRNAEDLAIVFNAIQGSDKSDQSLIEAAFNYKADLDIRKLKIGYIKTDFEKQYPFHINDSLALSEIKKMGIELIPIELPNYPLYDLGIILSAEGAAAFDELTLSGKDDLMVRQIKNAWPNVFRAARSIPAVEYINANRIRSEIIQEMKSLMEKVDVYFSPSFEGNNLLLTNLTGHPSVVIPNGFDNDGLPTSFTITGNLFQEGNLISLAKKFQEITDHHKKHPKL